MKKIFFLLLVLIPFLIRAQTTTAPPKQIICKKWFLEKYKEQGGKIYPVTAEMKSEYTLYKSDGTVESIEDGGVKINGKWELDEKAMTLTVTQTQNKSYPQKIVCKVLKLTDTNMVIQSKDAGGSLLTLYLTTSP